MVSTVTISTRLPSASAVSFPLRILGDVQHGNLVRSKLLEQLSGTDDPTSAVRQIGIHTSFDLQIRIKRRNEQTNTIMYFSIRHFFCQCFHGNLIVNLLKSVKFPPVL